MAAQQSISQNPSSLVHPATADHPPPPPSSSVGVILSTLMAKRPAVRVTTEFDSEGSMYTQKISCKLMENLAKLKLGFRHNSKGQVDSPQLSFISKFLSVDYDVEDENAVFKGKVDFGPAVHLKATHDVKYKQGELAMIADLAGPAYKLELASVFPSVGLPKATFKFPLGEVSLVEKEAEEEEEKVKRMLSIDGILKGQALSGICTAHYTDENLNLRYAYKDEQMSFIPSISLPSNTLSMAFKRRFGPSDKLSYLYNFDSNFWSAVYKHTVGKDYKFKAGYDSEVRLGWASLWVGDEAGKAKSAPMKTKVQFMLQVPRDEIQSSSFMFRVKKRWDI